MSANHVSATRVLIGAVTALGIATVLAGPASAQQTVEPRTGKLHEDCDRFSVDVTSEHADMTAWCRVSDDNDDREQTSTNLSDEVGYEEDPATETARLYWGGSGFHSVCSEVGLHVWTNGITLVAYCETETIVHSEHFLKGLASYYRVNAKGEIVVN